MKPTAMNAMNEGFRELTAEELTGVQGGFLFLLLLGLGPGGGLAAAAGGYLLSKVL